VMCDINERIAVKLLYSVVMLQQDVEQLQFQSCYSQVRVVLVSMETLSGDV